MSHHPRVFNGNADLRAALAALDPPARDAIATELLRYRDSAGDELAEVIDTH